MNFKMSKNSLTSAVVLSLSCCNTAFAADKLLNQNTQTAIFRGGISGLFLQPYANDLQYAVYTTPLPLPAPNWYPQMVKPKYRASFNLEVDYDFSNGVDFIALDWLDFRSNSYANFAVTEPNTSIGPLFYFGPAEQFLLNTSANSAIKFIVDDVNLVLKHSIAVSKPIQIEPFMGVNLAYLREHTTNNFAGADPVFGPYTHSVYLESHFTGFGPRLGLDTQYFVSTHYGLNASMAGSVLVGNLITSTDFNSWTSYTGGNAPHNNIPVDTTLSKQNQTTIVPKIDAKFGIFYTTSFLSGTSLTAQAGYMFNAYINAINQVLPSTLVPASWEAGTVAIVNQVQQQSNLSLNGPYITISWK